MCAQSINIIIDTDLLLMKIKFTGMLLTKENHISALGRPKQDRANIILRFCVVHNMSPIYSCTSTAYETNMAN